MTLEFREFSLYGPLFEGAVRVYAAAFALPPHNDGPPRDIGALMRHNHVAKPGIVRVVALEGGEAAGMGYGFHIPEEDWWGDRVRPNLSPETARAWLDDAFCVVELAVDPGHQRRGIGGAILERLLEGRDEKTAVLSTRTDSRGHLLYRRHGFEALTEMRFDGAGPWFHIMGRRLGV